ncbi:hypothetical protein DSO57_1017539 [Entomophthora muscae]|uniref:Uncharacterized protein n=1 Tax=Entomophthora muscae TaxID=34485 RepID=A0ACC2U3P1_9FUNG|nr:hypothetical protein DSO57_1017539 [Entomophthora muscae]
MSLPKRVADPSFLMIQDNNFLWAYSSYDFVDSHLIKRPSLNQLTRELEARLQNALPSSKLLQAKLMYRWYKGQKISRLIKCPP